LRVKSIKVIILIALVFLVIAGAGTFVYYHLTKVVPPELLKEALNNTFNAKSYSYRVRSTLYVDGKERLLSDIEGRKDANDNFHIKGTMLKQEVEIYQIGDTTYFKESSGDKWMVLENNNIMNMEQFVTEVNPLSNFNFVIPEQVKYLGREEVNGRTCHVITCAPDVENRILELHWKNFQYRFWVDKGKRVIRKALLKAQGKENSKALLELQVELSGFNKGNEIIPPKSK